VGGVRPRSLKVMVTVTWQSVYRQERAHGVNWLAHRFGSTDGVEGVEGKGKLYALLGINLRLCVDQTLY
jgi:hypothetical protein